jgi:hypothetical protein
VLGNEPVKPRTPHDLALADIPPRFHDPRVRAAKTGNFVGENGLIERTFLCRGRVLPCSPPLKDAVHDLERCNPLPGHFCGQQAELTVVFIKRDDKVGVVPEKACRKPVRFHDSPRTEMFQERARVMDRTASGDDDYVRHDELTLEELNGGF